MTSLQLAFVFPKNLLVFRKIIYWLILQWVSAHFEQLDTLNLQKTSYDLLLFQSLQVSMRCRFCPELHCSRNVSRMFVLNPHTLEFRHKRLGFWKEMVLKIENMYR